LWYCKSLGKQAEKKVRHGKHNIEVTWCSKRWTKPNSSATDTPPPKGAEGSRLGGGKHARRNFRG